MTGAAAPTWARARRGCASLLLVVLSGLLMLLAGTTLATTGWGGARPFAIGGGLAIQIAFLLERRAVHHWHPLPHRGRRRRQRLIGSALVSMAGAGLVLVGHLATTHGWWPTGVAIAPSLVGVTVAARFNRRSAAA